MGRSIDGFNRPLLSKFVFERLESFAYKFPKTLKRQNICLESFFLSNIKTFDHHNRCHFLCMFQRKPRLRKKCRTQFPSVPGCWTRTRTWAPMAQARILPTALGLALGPREGLPLLGAHFLNLPSPPSTRTGLLLSQQTGEGILSASKG